MPDCMFDFRLSDDGKIELANIAESTEDHIMKTCYPDLSNVLVKAEQDDAGTCSEAWRKQVRDAVESERKRIWDSQPPAREAETLVGRDIQRQLGAASWS